MQQIETDRLAGVMGDHLGRPRDDASLLRELLAEPSEQSTLPRVVSLAVELVPGCELAGLSLRRAKGKVASPASTHPLVDELDAAQYEFDEGPALDAIRGPEAVVVDDTDADERWPGWLPLAASRGVRSVLSVRLATAKEVLGGLNLYSRHRYAFDQDAVRCAHRFAASVSTAVSVMAQMDGLRTAMRTRRQIGMAQGMVMLRYGLDEDQAFQFMSRLSQSHNVKLRDVAARLVDELSKGEST